MTPRRHHSRLSGALGLALPLVLLVSLVMILSPPHQPPLPPGWQLWPEPGCTFALVRDGNDVLAGGSRGLFRIAPDGTVAAVRLPGLPPSVLVNALALDRDGTLWIGHSQGLTLCRGGRGTTLTPRDGLPYRSVQCLALTHDGAAWVGTQRGAARIPGSGPWTPETITVLRAADGLPHDVVSAITEDPDGGIWFGTSAAPAGGLARLCQGRWCRWTTADGLPHANVASLLTTRSGEVWAGCGLLNQGGAAIFRPHRDAWRLDRLLHGADLAGPRVRSLSQDRSGRLWLGAEAEGLTIVDRHRIVEMIPLRDFLTNGEVLVSVEDTDGRMWLGTPLGAVRLPPGLPR